jgi:hypothetical protein
MRGGWMDGKKRGMSFAFHPLVPHDADQQPPVHAQAQAPGHDRVRADQGGGRQDGGHGDVGRAG